jgi:hypothetical protein
MRRLGTLLTALAIGLAAAPAAGATETPRVTHEDTPAELADANLANALATGRLTSRSTSALPQYLPTTWCGARREVDDTADAAFPPTSAQIKVVYAYASDQPDRFATWRDSLQANVARIEEYLALQSGGRRALRFDMGTDCGPQYLDIQVVPLAGTRASYLDDFNDVANDVADHVDFGPGPRNVMILGDNLTDSGVYGTGEVLPQADDPSPSNAHNAGGLIGVMWVDAGTTPNATGWQPTVMLHEMTHTLGGVSWSAPHTSHPPGDMTGTYSHCWDGQDVMCYDDGPGKVHPYESNHCPLAAGAIAQTYDCGHDDYYDPEPPPASYLATHWNVYNSVFMGPCTSLGSACGGDIVPTPPVNQGAPGVSGSAARRGIPLTASVGTWLNAPTSYSLRWQRAVAGSWLDIDNGTYATYVPSTADVGASLRVLVTATNGDGAAIAASAPTPAIADIAKAGTRNLKVRIRLRDKGKRTAGMLTASVRAVVTGREVSTRATQITLPSGKWRLKLCAGPQTGSLRCALTARVRARKRGSVRLPAAKVVARTKGKLRVTAAIVDARQRVRAQGQAASV